MSAGRAVGARQRFLRQPEGGGPRTLNRRVLWAYRCSHDKRIVGGVTDAKRF